MTKITKNQETLDLGAGITLERSVGIRQRNSLLYVWSHGVVIALTREDLEDALSFLDSQEEGGI